MRAVESKVEPHVLCMVVVPQCKGDVLAPRGTAKGCSVDWVCPNVWKVCTHGATKQAKYIHMLTVGATLKQALDKEMKELSLKDTKSAGGGLPKLSILMMKLFLFIW